MEKKSIKKYLRKERGAEMLQVVLISGVLLVLIITLFYPQMENLFTIVHWSDYYDIITYKQLRR